MYALLIGCLFCEAANAQEPAVVTGPTFVVEAAPSGGRRVSVEPAALIFNDTTCVPEYGTFTVVNNTEESISVSARMSDFDGDGSFGVVPEDDDEFGGGGIGELWNLRAYNVPAGMSVTREVVHDSTRAGRSIRNGHAHLLIDLSFGDRRLNDPDGNGYDDIDEGVVRLRAAWDKCTQDG